MRRLAVLIAVAAFVGLCLIALTANSILPGVGRWLVVTTPVQKVDLIVALGGDRARQERAVELYRQGIAPFILFTGADARDRDYGCLGVPAEAALPVSEEVFTTNGEADTVREVVEKNHYRSVLIVTSPYHSRRALEVFRKTFRGRPVEVLLTTCDPPAFLHQKWWKSHMGVKTILTEYFGLGYYWMKGYL